MAYEGQAAPRARVEFGPAPDAFPLEPYDIGERDPRALSERGLCYWFSDTLADLSGPERVHCSRLIQQVTGSDGLQPSASIEIVFDPRFERLIVHTVRVWRDGQAREAASPEAFELLRRELNLERAVYDGRITAHMIVPDVRVGDVVESAYSIIGSNPVLGDAFAYRFRFQWTAPAIETRCRLRAPEQRRLTIRTFGDSPEPTETVSDGVREVTWRLLDAPPYRHEPDAPQSYIGYAAVHVADESSWTAVADLVRDAYALPHTIPADLAAAIDQIAAAHPTPQARAAEGLRFVQRSLRYHAIGIGDGGYRPRPVEAIWATRYGDCKDASRLLSTVLTRLGVDACCALVSTWQGADLDPTVPTPFAFDHCIVRARIDGTTYWLDPTAPPQSGRLNRLTQAAHGWALPLEEGASLEEMPPPAPVFAADIHEDWTFSKRADASASLKVESVYEGWRADHMRRWCENDGVQSVARRLREGLESQYGVLSESSPLGWLDEADENRLVVTESYLVDRPYTPIETPHLVCFDARDDLIGPNLRTPESARRLEPIALGPPRRLRIRRTLRFPVEVQVSPWDVRVDGPGLAGRSAFSWSSGRTAEHLIDFQVREPVVPAARAPLYFDFARRMWNANGLRIAVPVRGGKLRKTDDGQPGWVTIAVVVAILAVLALLRAVG
ncbi:DUF3857 domain-containing protein [Brevundimonas sp.]|uniref:DUF3857 domain-containing protein n=1 Tax=Brevundimonas sp. TaxID=1871086 RepID=UPI0025D4C414|nr:DUF3857 domain-containing protein [Brevundimonas sp.]